MYGDQNPLPINNVPPSIPRPPGAGGLGNYPDQFYGNQGGYGQTNYGMYGPDFAMQAAKTVDYNSAPGSSFVSETQTVTTNTNYNNMGTGYNATGGYGYGAGYNQAAQMAEMSRVSGVSGMSGVTSMGGATSYGGTVTGGMGVSAVEIVPPPPQPKSRSRIQYVPVEQKVIDYQTKEWIQTVPRQKTVTQYEERRWTEQVPRQINRTEHYAVEHVREYVPEITQTRQMQVIPQQRIIQRTDYVPVERQINYGLQGATQVSQGRIIGYGQSVNHQVIPMGVTQGETTIVRGQASTPEIVGITSGTSNYYGSAGYGNTMVGNAGYGVSNYGPGYSEYSQTTTTTATNAGYPGYQGGYNNMGYGSGGAYIQTPGVVTNVNPNGSVVETPVVVTNKF